MSFEALLSRRKSPAAIMKKRCAMSVVGDFAIFPWPSGMPPTYSPAPAQGGTSIDSSAGVTVLTISRRRRRFIPTPALTEAPVNQAVSALMAATKLAIGMALTRPYKIYRPITSVFSRIMRSEPSLSTLVAKQPTQTYLSSPSMPQLRY